MAAEITNLWGILETPDDERQEFLSKHSTLSSSVVNACVEEIKRLKLRRRTRLPELIVAQTAQITELLEYLRIERAPLVASDDLEVVYEANELELARLRDLHKKMDPIITVVGEREQMLAELSSVQQELQKDQKGRIKNGKPDPKKQSKERRLRQLLPRLERRLLIMLLEFKEVTGTDFVWGGEAYVGCLSHILLSDTEKKSAVSRGRRVSTQGSARCEEPLRMPKGRRHSENRPFALDFR
jgi:hypothetical protein